MDSAQRNLETQIGIKRRFLWNAAAGFFFVPGSFQIVSWAFALTPNPLPLASVISGGVVPISLALAWFAMGRKEVSPLPSYHFVLVAGYMVLFTTSALDGNDNSADAVYQLMPMMIALVVFPLRQAAPYVLVGAVSSPAFVLLGDDPTPEHRAVVTGLCAVAIGVILAVGQQQLRHVLRRNRELSEIDELTGAANTRRLHERLQVELASMLRGAPQELCLVSIDLDGFKSVNDTFSHSVGDKMLVSVAESIARELAPRDMLVRRGGDEFTVLAHDQEARPVDELASRLGTAIGAARAAICPGLEAGSSIAVTRHRDGETVEDLLARSDSDLHDQKQLSHRDRPRTRTVTVAKSRWVDVSPTPATHANRDVHQAASHGSVVRRTAWQMLGWYLFAVALVVPLLTLVGRIDGLTGSGIVATCVIAASASAACLLLATESRLDWQLHVAIVVALAVTTALVAQSGEARNALVELYIVPAAIGFYAVGRRAAVVYVAIGLGLYVYFLETTAYDALFALRSVQTTVMLVLAGQFVPRAVKRARETAAENERLSGVDPLTGVANVRAMRRRVEFELMRSETGGCVSLVMVDLDNFKQVNDLHSHTLGDQLLKSVAATIVAEVRSHDLVVRRGGDEFVVVIPHDAAREVSLDLDEVVARVHSAIVACRMKVCPDVTPTASIGCVTSTAGDTVESLLTRADERENEAKRQAHELRGSLRSA